MAARQLKRECFNMNLILEVLVISFLYPSQNFILFCIWKKMLPSTLLRKSSVKAQNNFFSSDESELLFFCDNIYFAYLVNAWCIFRRAPKLLKLQFDLLRNKLSVPFLTLSREFLLVKSFWSFFDFDLGNKIPFSIWRIMMQNY